MKPGLFQLVPRTDWATPTPLPSRAGRPAPSAETSGPALGRWGCQGWAGTRPGATRQGVVPKPQPRPLRARKEAAAKVGATGSPRVRLTCGSARPGLLSSESWPAGGRRGPARPPCPPPTPELPRSSRRHPAAPCWGAGPPGPSHSRPARLLALLRLPRAGPGPGAGCLTSNPPQLRDALREGGDCGEGGALPASRGLGRAWPPSRQRRAPRPYSAGPARCAGSRGCWRAASASARAPAGEGPGCSSSRAAAAETQRGREGGVRPRRARRPREPQP